MSNVLVTGAAGFIGCNVVKQLLVKGHNVIGLDNMLYGKERNIAEFINHSNFVFHKADVRDDIRLKELSRDVDTIFHLAALKIPIFGNVIKTISINYHGTENVLEAAAENGCKVIFSSSSDVYGKSKELPFNEDKTSLTLGNTNIKRWSYGSSKILDEHMCFAYHTERDVPVVVLRYFNSYGPWNSLTQMYGPVPPFIDAALQGKPITVHGDGKQTRCYTYVEDIANGTVLAMDSEKAVGEVINIGSIEEITILSLAELVIKLTVSKSKIEFVPHEKLFGKYEEIMRRVPDITKAKKLLGYEPKVPLEDGLRRTIEWQKAVRDEIGF